MGAALLFLNMFSTLFNTEINTNLKTKARWELFVPLCPANHSASFPAEDEGAALHLHGLLCFRMGKQKLTGVRGYSKAKSWAVLLMSRPKKEFVSSIGRTLPSPSLEQLRAGKGGVLGWPVLYCAAPGQGLAPVAGVVPLSSAGHGDRQE